MNKRIEKHNKRFTNILYKHYINNKKEYFIAAIVFLIGIIIGILTINNMDIDENNEIKDYLISFIQYINTGYIVDTTEMLKATIINNITIAISFWIIGSAVIGLPLIFIIVALRGYMIGYTISAIKATFATKQAILFNISALALQNIIFIPCILALAVSGINVYKSIIKNKRKENIKIEIIRHTIFSFFIMLILIIEAFIETYGSSNLITQCTKILM